MAFMQVDFFSEVLRMSVQANVVIPQNTRGQIGMEGKAEEKYPTLYLLHGMSDDQTIWMRRTSIERYVANRGMAVVMPTTHLGWYTDTTYGLKYFTFITEELPRVMQNFFRGMSDRREDNYIAGLSMGGYGALKSALAHPETFAAAASLSGAVDIVGITAVAQHGRGFDFWKGVFGESDKIAGSENDLHFLAEDCRKKADRGECELPELFMWCGTEDALLGGNQELRDHFEALNYHLSYSESAGVHAWEYWDEQIQNVLKWIDGLRG